MTIQAATAQSNVNKKAQNSFDKAQAYLNNNEYDQAIAILNEAVASDPSFVKAYIQLAEINRRVKAYEAAKSSYLQAIKLDPAVDARIYYGLAECQLLTGDYTPGLGNIMTFLKNYAGSDKDFIKKAEKYKKDLEFASLAINKPQPYEPVNLGPNVNSSHRDYFPAITADGETLIFSRNINGNEDFFMSRKDAKGWAAPLPLSDQINTTQFNEGAQSITPDGQYLFFTGCNRPDGLGRCDIYVSHKEGNSWGKPFNLGAPVNSAFWDSQPAISPDGSTLFFVSNRPGGLGGYDIWKSTLNKEGYWADPVNLGPEINTPYDEHTPYLHADGKTLYFSSDGWPGFGNKDIFKTVLRDDGHWLHPLNLGYPINTFNEETGLIVTPDGSQALFSSDLKGGYGDMDIYQFQLPQDKRPLPITYVKGIVRDQESKAFLDANVQVVNLNQNKVVYDDYTSAENGSFLVVMPLGDNYAFHASADGYALYSENYPLTTGSSSKPFVVEIYLQKLKVGTNMVLKNIFFDTNDFKLLPESVSELSTLLNLLKSNPNVQMEIQGHTDNVGNDQLNEQLSLNRAKAVYEYLLDNQIDPQRLQYKGYGAKKPVVANDTEDNRRLNRRTSFVITKI
ncbi:possible outer membrane protein [Pedobacter sp. BAL39]|nr:possible outer membrane protein [Pedobacter sp. BAL39]